MVAVPAPLLPRLAHRVVHGCYLNLLWLLCCLPVLTAPAATAALHAAVHRWSVDGTPPSARRFGTDLRGRAGEATAVGLLLVLALGLLLWDLRLIGEMGWPRRPMFVLWLAAAGNVAVAGAFALAAASRPDAAPGTGVRRLGAVLRAGAVAGYRHPGLALLAGAVPLAAALVVAAFPVALLGAGVVTVAVVDQLWQRARAS